MGKKKYNLGSFERALNHMLECAIRDRESMIEGCTPRSDLIEIDEFTQNIIDDCKRAIEDFKRVHERLKHNG